MKELSGRVRRTIEQPRCSAVASEIQVIVVMTRSLSRSRPGLGTSTSEYSAKPAIEPVARAKSLFYHKILQESRSYNLHYRCKASLPCQLWTSRVGGNPRYRERSQERLGLLRRQELLAGLGIQSRWKKPTDIQLPAGDSDRPQGPWHVLPRGTHRHSAGLSDQRSERLLTDHSQ